MSEKDRPQFFAKLMCEEFLELEKQTVINMVKKFMKEEPKRTNYIDWKKIVAQMDTGITAKQCQQIWQNYRNRCDRKSFTKEEDRLLLEKVKQLGPKWWLITDCFPNRRPGSLKRRYGELTVQQMEEHSMETFKQSLPVQTETKTDFSFDVNFESPQNSFELGSPMFTDFPWN